MKILGELATLILCIKDGISVEDIKNYICPNIIPILESEKLDSAITSLYDGTESSYLLQDINIWFMLRQLEQTSIDKVIAIISTLSTLPLNKEEILQLMLPEELLSRTEKSVLTQSENISTQECHAVSIVKSIELIFLGPSA